MLKKKSKYSDNHFVPVVRTGGIATAELGEGRLIPVLILDCKNHKSLLELIYLHEDSPPGDVKCTWGANSKFFYLLFDFSRPTEVSCGVKFEISSQWRVADGIVRAKGVYLQPIDSGENVLAGIHNSKVLVEVSPEAKMEDWDARIIKFLRKKLRKNGFTRKDSISASKSTLDENREFWAQKVN
ncbi:hypothetical protein M0G74_12465 [Microbulbifer sp. CAU 1566]|uniref:hypothetical protein n=1 Tax=Microbulbifer sp. CAU 1566 TaxID=2933269 RepID=UPI002005DBA7|nr:hypothetical protein [Microbulbifer sp. CAU 1566]MCK7598087.1 hypothetical protein [Microbulbifer sp. CAU 1566]